jgi:extracellular elastinolytic metalloproteinase
MIFQQTVGDVPVSPEGGLSVGVRNGRVAYASSEIAGDLDGVGSDPRLGPKQAISTAAENAGMPVAAGELERIGFSEGYIRFKTEELTNAQLARLVAVPTPGGDTHLAFETFIVDNDREPEAFSHYVDAQTGGVLIRTFEVDYQQAPEDDPSRWKVFPNTPRMDYSSTDTRQIWCWDATSAECERVLRNDASPFPWDVNVAKEESSFTTSGNNAIATEKWNTNNTGRVGNNPATPREDRDYSYEWTNQWAEEKCNPDVFTSPQRNDIDAAAANLFAMHNRMHDFSFHLGFTEALFNLQEHNFGDEGRDNDPELGQVQAGGIVGARRAISRVTTRTRSPRRTGGPPSPTCTCGRTCRAVSTPPASTATSTCR